jgi:hypothetical protein
MIAGLSSAWSLENRGGVAALRIPDRLVDLASLTLSSYNLRSRKRERESARSS